MTRLGLSGHGSPSDAAGCLVIGADGSMSAGSGREAALAVAVVADRLAGPDHGDRSPGEPVVDRR